MDTNLSNLKNLLAHQCVDIRFLFQKSTAFTLFEDKLLFKKITMQMQLQCLVKVLKVQTSTMNYG